MVVKFPDLFTGKTLINLNEEIFTSNSSKCVAYVNCHVIYTLLILYMLTLILEMCCSINTALHSMAVKWNVLFRKYCMTVNGS